MAWGWLEVDSPHKWLRWHPYQEWYDIWGNPKANEELLQFFDHFLKGKDNAWEKTPKVRMASLKFGNSAPAESIVVDDFPLPNTDYRKMYLAPGEKLASEPVHGAQGSTTVSYNAESSDSRSFNYTFDKPTRIMGMMDMDVYVFIEKLDKQGQPMLNLNIPWIGIPVNSFDEFTKEQSTEVVLYKRPTGILRASHRAIDWDRSMHPHWPYHPHEEEEKVPRGEVVKSEIGIWAMGIDYEAGEGIRVHVSGRNMAVSNFGKLDVDNKGEHKIQLGGEHQSHIILPFV
jgi:uncharacterized protein